MSIGYIILIIFAVLWSVGGGVYCYDRCQRVDYDSDSDDKYYILKLIFCHIIEGPIAWIIGIMIIACEIIQKIESLFGMN